jgi:hypothetical protein
MERRTFLSSLLGGIGLGWLAPKAKAEAVKPVWRDCLHFVTDSSKGEHHAHPEMVLYGLVNGWPVFQLLAQNVSIQSFQRNARTVDESGKVTWEGCPRQETQLSVGRLVGPRVVADKFYEVFADVTKAKENSLAFVLPGVGGRIDVQNVVITSIGYGAATASFVATESTAFMGTKTQVWNDGMLGEDLRMMYDNGLKSGRVSAPVR